MKLRKLGSIGNEAEGHNTLCIGRATEMNMTNGLWKQGCLIQRRQLKIIGQDIRVETYKEGDKIPFQQLKAVTQTFNNKCLPN